MVSVEVIIGAGVRDDAHRKRARQWVITRYRAHGYPVTVGTCRGKWRKAAAVNPAANASTADVLVIADADCVVDADGIRRAIGHAQRDGYAVPAKAVRRLTPDATAGVLDGDPAADLDPRLPTESRHQLLAGGGIVVIRKDVWDAVGGFDPRFVGWGGEDYALGCALYSATRQFPQYGAGLLWHLWHPPQTRDQRLTPDNEHLANRYRQAKHDPIAMQQLHAEAREV